MGLAYTCDLSSQHLEGRSRRTRSSRSSLTTSRVEGQYEPHKYTSQKGGGTRKKNKQNERGERRAPLGTIEARVASPGVFECQDEAGKMSQRDSCGCQDCVGLCLVFSKKPPPPLLLGMHCHLLPSPAPFSRLPFLEAAQSKRDFLCENTGCSLTLGSHFSHLARGRELEGADLGFLEL